MAESRLYKIAHLAIFCDLSFVCLIQTGPSLVTPIYELSDMAASSPNEPGDLLITDELHHRIASGSKQGKCRDHRQTFLLQPADYASIRSMRYSQKIQTEILPNLGTIISLSRRDRLSLLPRAHPGMGRERQL
jgi:hypothetical protein